MIRQSDRDTAFATLCAAVLVFAAFFGAYAGRELDRPSPRVGEGERKPPQRQSASDQSPTQDRHETTISRSAPTAKSHTSTDGAKSLEKSTSDWWTAFFTGGLVLVGAGQAGLFLWQLRYMRRGMDDAALAAKAAKESADSTRESVGLAKITAQRQLRAYVYVSEAHLERDGPMVHITVKNFGVTPAYNVRISARHQIVEGGGDPSFPWDNFPSDPTDIEVELAPGQELVAQRSASGGYETFLYGRITYKTAFATNDETRFILKRDDDDQRGRLIVMSGHNQSVGWN
jgi:hypothetical protein